MFDYSNTRAHEGIRIHGEEGWGRWKKACGMCERTCKCRLSRKLVQLKLTITKFIAEIHRRLADEKLYITRSRNKTAYLGSGTSMSKNMMLSGRPPSSNFRSYRCSSSIKRSLEIKLPINLPGHM